jgi:TetR/AcrR family transcriptional repressor of nem operon
MARVTDTRDRLLEATVDLVWNESLGAASVDAICEKAGVRKGSFYHFFKSKDDLVVAALEAHFDAARVDYDRLFSPSVAPVDRLKGFFEALVRKQQMKRDKVGRVVGCPYATAAMACSSTENFVRERVQNLLATWKKYVETTLRDGIADGSIPAQDIPRTVETVFDYIEGALTIGRIQNSMLPIQNIGYGAFKLIGLEAAPAPATAART